METARIRWYNGVPFSEQFNDVYFSREGVLQEFQYVFLEGNDLPARWRRSRAMVIAELGFGTGLNFLLTLSQWLELAPQDASLHYIAVEKYPVAPNELSRILALWPQLQTLSGQLLAAYPMLVSGMHQRNFCNNRVRLTLLFGDVQQCLPELHARVDAWYLDGFAPSKNPQMWSLDVFEQLRRLSAPQASFATFSASGFVRRGLEQVGFSVKKLPGFGRKREMLAGTLRSGAQGPAADLPPWFVLPHEQFRGERRHAVIVGAGLAGISTAVALRRRGWQVTLCERHQQEAQEASGNLSGVVLPQLSADMAPAARFYLSAFLHTVAYLRQSSAVLDDFAWHETGVLQLSPVKKQQALARLGLPEQLLHSCSWQQAQQLCGLPLAGGEQLAPVFFPQAGWLGPRQFCRALLNAVDGIDLRMNCAVSKLEFDGEQWHLWQGDKRIVQAPVVILASAYDTMQLLPSMQANLQKLRGQLSYVQSSVAPGLRLPVCYDGYVIPENQGMYCAGASYERCQPGRVAVAEVREQDHHTVLHALAQHIRSFAGVQPFGGRCAFRTSSTDHLPMIGPVIDEGYYRQQYQSLHHGKPASHYPPGRYLPGLYINTGHGSRGLVSCLPAAELIACLLNDEPLPLPVSILPVLHSGRFLVRELKRR